MSKGKRALFLVLTDRQGGAERVAAALANRLNARGWRVEWRIIDPRPASPSHSASSLSSEITVRRSGFGGFVLGFLLLPLRLAGGRYDFVFTTHVYSNALISLLLKLNLIRARRFVSRESTAAFDRFRGLKRVIYSLLYRLYGRQDMIVAQTIYMAEHVKPWLPGHCRIRVVVLPNPVDFEAIDEAGARPPPGDVVVRLAGRVNVLFCGRLIDVKQPLLALDAFRRLLADASGGASGWPQLVYMGDGPLRQMLEKAVGACGLGASVVFLGQQANPYAIIRMCQYGLLTSSHEGFPNVVLEMMACGVRKIVMTPCAGGLDALQDVTVTTDFSASSLAEALSAAIRSGEDFSTTYRKVVEQRSPEAYLDNMLG